MNSYIPIGAYNQQGFNLGQAAPNNLLQSGYGQISDLNLNPEALSAYGGSNATYQSIGSAMGYDVPSITAGANQGLGGWLAANEATVKSGVGLITAGLGAWQGYNSNKLAKQQMGMQADQFNQQMSLSKGLLNQNMEDRQRARVASNPHAYQSVSEYMNKYGVK